MKRLEILVAQVVELNIDNVCEAKPQLESCLRRAQKPIIEHVYFHCVTEYIQADAEDVTINQYHLQKMEEMKDQSTEDEYQRMENSYKSMLDHYNKLNHSNKLDLKQRKHRENQAGKNVRFEGAKFKDFNISEFENLMNVKFDKHHPAHTFYKRLVSDKPYLYLTNYSEFQSFNTFLKERINQSTDKHPNIRYYKLEKALNFELHKSIFKKLHEARNTELYQGLNQETIMGDLLLVEKNPLIAFRHEYIDRYPLQDGRERQSWLIELEIIWDILIQSIGSVLDLVLGLNLDEEIDWEYYHRIYSPSSYERDYKMRRDFNKKDYKAFMAFEDKYNEKVRQKIDEIYP